MKKLFLGTLALFGCALILSPAAEAKRVPIVTENPPVLACTTFSVTGEEEPISLHETPFKKRGWRRGDSGVRWELAFTLYDDLQVTASGATVVAGEATSTALRFSFVNTKTKKTLWVADNGGAGRNLQATYVVPEEVSATSGGQQINCEMHFSP